MTAVWRAPEGYRSMVLTWVRAHAQVFMNIHESCLQEVLHMKLEGVRQAESSFARVVHEILVV